MLETEFALTPANLEVFAKTSLGRVRIKQGNNFVFNGVERIDFEDADSTLHFFFPEDAAYALADSANRINVTRVFNSQRGKDYVLVGVPFSWIDVAPKGTLIIDPTTTVATSEDVWLETTSNFDGHSAGLLVGKVAGTSKKRTIIKFNFAGSGVPSSATVLNAQMKMYYYGTGGSGWVDRWLQAHQILVNWAEAQATSVNRLTGTAWNVAHVGLNDIDAKSSYESTLFFYLVGGQQVYGWKSWDLTSLTQKWVSGTATNYGVVLWATNETTDGKDLRFYSSEATAPNDVNRPYLEVIYSQQAKTVYFLKDHLGSVRATVQDTVGAPVRGYDDYDPWGYILAGRSLASSILPTTTRNKFTEKEWDDEFGLNWSYFGARYYDAQIGRWPVRDLFAEKYPSLTPYHYAANNPVNVIDINGDSTFVVANENGTYTVTGGNLSGDEDDTGIYTRDANGNLVLVGQSITTHSFFDDKDKAVVGAVIDPNSYEGVLFVLGEIVGGDPSLTGYMMNATGGQKYDFKSRGLKEALAEGVKAPQHHYRGSVVPFTGSVATFGSARDFGNIGAGIVAGRAGLSWATARSGFDTLESIQKGRISTEGTPTQKAQRVGYDIGVRLRKLN